MPGTAPENNRGIRKRATIRRKRDFKKLISHFNLKVFLRVVWILSQLTAFVLKPQQKRRHGQKSTVWKTAFNTSIFTY